MNITTIIGISVLFVVIIFAAIVFNIRRPKKLKGDRFLASWRHLQTYCRDTSTWPQAIIEADKLLDAALKKRKLKGKTMGARMVAAQRIFTDNDDMWYAHNLAKKLAAGNDIKLKESDVKNALLGFRTALRDIGALPGSKDQLDDNK